MSSVVLSGDTSGSGTITVPAVAGTFTATMGSATGTHYPFTSSTAVTASGTSVTFSNIPSWVKRVTVMWVALSTNGTSDLYVQIGDAGGIVATGYAGNSTSLANAAAVSIGDVTVGLKISATTSAANSGVGQAIISKLSGNTWVMTSISRTGNSNTSLGASSLTLSSDLTQLKVVTGNGTDAFDAGTINILYE